MSVPMKQGLVLRLLVLLLPAVILLAGCQSDGPPTGGGGDNDVYYLEVGPDGGVIEVTDPASPLYGAKVVIPDSALRSPTTISLEICPEGSQPPCPENANLVSPVVTLGPGGTQFRRQVEITLPYTAHEGMEHQDLMMYTFGQGGKQLPLLTQEIDSIGYRITASTLHFSTVAAYELPWPSDPTPRDSPFDISEDVLEISNNQTSGTCLAMCNLALWYLENARPECGKLRGRNTEEREIELAEDARLALPKIIPNWPDIFEGRFLYGYIDRSLELGQPVIVLVQLPEHEDMIHALLADQITVNGDDVRIMAYDPNHPSELRPIVFDQESKIWVYDSDLGRCRVHGITNTALAPEAMNTALHAGTWVFEPALLTSMGLPCGVSMVASEAVRLEVSAADEHAVSVGFNIESETLHLVGSIGGRVGSATLTLSGPTYWMYDQAGPQAETGFGTLANFAATFACDLECEGVGMNRSNGCLASLPIASYGYSFTGRREGIEMEQSSPQTPALSDSCSNLSGLFWSKTEQSPDEDVVGLVVETEFPKIIDWEVRTPLVVRAGLRSEDGEVVYQAGIDILVAAVGGLVEPWQGITDEAGYFTASVTMPPLFNCVEITVIGVYMPRTLLTQAYAAGCRPAPPGAWLIAWGSGGVREFVFDPRLEYTYAAVMPDGSLGIGFNIAHSPESYPIALATVPDIRDVAAGETVECRPIHIAFPDGAAAHAPVDLGCAILRSYVTFTKIELPSSGDLWGRISGEFVGCLAIEPEGDGPWERADVIDARFEEIVVVGETEGSTDPSTLSLEPRSLNDHLSAQTRRSRRASP